MDVDSVTPLVDGKTSRSIDAEAVEVGSMGTSVMVFGTTTGISDPPVGAVAVGISVEDWSPVGVADAVALSVGAFPSTTSTVARHACSG